MFHFLVAITLAVSLPLASLQLLPSVGVCSEQNVTDFVTQLPNGEECRSAIEVILGPEKMPSRLQQALGTFCTHTCGEAYTKFTSENCKDIQYTFRLIVYCLPVPTFPEEQNRCRFAFPDVLGNDLINNLQNCMDFDPKSPSCNPDCQLAIEDFTNGTQCCYQNLYNSTLADPEVLKGLISNGFLTEAQGELVVNASHYALWEACEVPLTTFCFGEYFVGPQSLVAGICTQDRIDNFIETLSKGCHDSYGIVRTENTAVSTNELEDAYDSICTQDCGGMVAKFERDVCLDNFDSYLSTVGCYRTNGDLGSYCTFTIEQHLGNANYFTDAQTYCTNVYDSSTTDCPPSCSDALKEVAKQLGCCYQSVYNNTEARDLLLVNEDINYFDWVFFQLLGNANLWNACEVPLIESCTENPLIMGSKGEILVPSILIIVLTLFFSLLLY